MRRRRSEGRGRCDVGRKGSGGKSRGRRKPKGRKGWFNRYIGEKIRKSCYIKINVTQYSVILTKCLLRSTPPPSCPFVLLASLLLPSSTSPQPTQNQSTFATASASCRVLASGQPRVAFDPKSRTKVRTPGELVEGTGPTIGPVISKRNFLEMRNLRFYFIS